MNKPEKRMICRNVATEGAVLLKNENKVLPFKSGSAVAGFGRNFYYSFKGGAGSGDILGVFPVNTSDAFKNTDVSLVKEVAEYYESYNAERYESELKFWNRINRKWVNSLKEAPVPYEIIEKAKKITDTAVVSFGRSSGEWYDIPADKGSYYLSDTEEELLKAVSESFPKTVVVLNYCGVMDLSFAEKYKIDAIVYASMGGEETGNAIADVLTGKVNPSGKLSDTWGRLEDYPTHKSFQELEIPYEEGIYVGYRYFDSFGVEPIYPFGFGLSYTDFEISVKSVDLKGSLVEIEAEVENIGDTAGKEVIEVYLSEPDGKMPKAYQQLVAFCKTEVIKPKISKKIKLCFDICNFACYDEENAEFVLEKGDYFVRVGNSSRNTHIVAKIILDENAVTFKTVNRAVPQRQLDLISPKGRKPYTYKGEEQEKANCKALVLRKSDIKCREAEKEVRVPAELQKVDGKLHKLCEVAKGEITMEQFVAQFKNEQLADILNGVTGGTMSAGTHVGTMAKSIKGAAGEIWSDEGFGIPACINADGPTGIRLGSFIGAAGIIPVDTEHNLQMTAFPIATCVANTWNPKLAEDFGRAVSADMDLVGLDGWLAPAMNIHRNPLCGRNFEYFSEDPLLSGVISAGEVKGIQTNADSTPSGYYATIKHFAANNAELYRFDSDSIVSERALREIYLKGFKVAIDIAKPIAVMNSYNKVNGEYASDSFDLNMGILRYEWGFEGCVMTDWSAKSTDSKMPNAGCDLVMPGWKNKSYLKLIEEGVIPRSVAQRSAVNVMNVALKTAYFRKSK